jgi:hypothetical protein
MQVGQASAVDAAAVIVCGLNCKQQQQLCRCVQALHCKAAVAAAAAAELCGYVCCVRVLYLADAASSV